ncbi:Pentraxin-Related Protein Ptx3 [Manis pentadactyla]|nr:Pentraxin-Related Protein Ptx3 [Manis pentadactyla]
MGPRVSQWFQIIELKNLSVSSLGIFGDYYTGLRYHRLKLSEKPGNLSKKPELASLSMIVLDMRWISEEVWTGRGWASVTSLPAAVDSADTFQKVHGDGENKIKLRK